MPAKNKSRYPNGTGIFQNPPLTALAPAQPPLMADYADPRAMAVERMGLPTALQTDPNSRYQAFVEQAIGQNMADPLAVTGIALGAALSNRLGGADPVGAIPQVAQNFQQDVATNAQAEAQYGDAQTQANFEAAKNFLRSQGANEAEASYLALNPQMYNIGASEKRLGMAQDQMQMQAALQQLGLQQRTQYQNAQIQNSLAKLQQDLGIAQDKSNVAWYNAETNRQRVNAYKDRVNSLMNNGLSLGDRIAKTPQLVLEPGNLSSYLSNMETSVMLAPENERLEIYKSYAAFINNALSRASSAKGSDPASFNQIRETIRMATEANPDFQKLLNLAVKNQPTKITPETGYVKQEQASGPTIEYNLRGKF